MRGRGSLAALARAASTYALRLRGVKGKVLKGHLGVGTLYYFAQLFRVNNLL
jgi:hypothetical protein